ncbi:tripartite motif-containing protein 2-like [Anneissia japonica]|uniref:tripartite motif-containing protein 2-like n=1 Tax=Anneissia japonica TaxID=1529436 RepID=UPI001425B52E|nr:tripartite motif-containing protein 2-like [Anneissia japonica]
MVIKRQSFVLVFNECLHLLNCPVCFQQYDRPKRLKCEHVFCYACLQKLAYNEMIKCPECRLVTNLSASTVSSLPSCVIIQRFLDEISKNNNDDKTCDNNYTNGQLDGAFDNLETPKHPCVNRLKNAIRLNYQPAIEHLKDLKRNIEQNLNSVRNSIDYFTDEVFRAVQERRKELRKKVDCYESRWLKPLENQIDSLEIEVHEKMSLVLVNQFALEETLYEPDVRSAVELLDIMNAFECGELSLSGIETLPQVLKQVSNLGNVSDVHNSGLMYTTDPIEKEVMPVLNKQSNLPCNFGPRGMCIINRPSRNDEKLMIVESSNMMCYEVSVDTNVVTKFPLNNSGKAVCFIDVTTINHGKKLIFSNFSSPVLKTFDLQFNECEPINLQTGSSSTLIPTPFSLTSDHRSHIYITDKRNHVIQVREESGALVRQFLCHGNPGYLAVWKDTLVVSDAENKCCYIYSVDGRLLSTIDQYIGVNFCHPMGVAFHEKGYILVADYLKKCVFSVSISGHIVSEVDLSGNIDPEGIAVHQNTVYVSNRLNGTILKVKLSNFPPKSLYQKQL